MCFNKNIGKFIYEKSNIMLRWVGGVVEHARLKRLQSVEGEAKPVCKTRPMAIWNFLKCLELGQRAKLKKTTLVSVRNLVPKGERTGSNPVPSTIFIDTFKYNLFHMYYSLCKSPERY